MEHLDLRSGSGSGGEKDPNSPEAKRDR
jgi:hypothetical protein